MNTNAIAYLLTTIMFVTATVAYPQTNDAAEQPDTAVFYHTVERGETVFSIARTYGVDTNAIYRLNPGSNEVIKIGQQLKIKQRKASDNSVTFIYHTIRPKETLYAVSQTYQVQASDIMKTNPGLDASAFQVGKNIRIPVRLVEEVLPEKPAEPRYIEYKVAKRETIYRIQRKFNISQEHLIRLNPSLSKGLKEGMILKIPADDQTPVPPASRELVSAEREVNALLNATRAGIERPDTIRIALLLPFMTADTVTTSASMHITEYYQGWLLAVDSLQRRGLNIKLTVRDVGYGIRTLPELLKERTLEEAHLIIGGIDNDQIAMIGAFALRHQSQHIIPFSSRNDEVHANAAIFQVNTPHARLVSQAANTAANLFKNHNIIFIDTHDPDDKNDFIGAAKHEFSLHNILFRNLIYRNESFPADLAQLMRNDMRNLVILMSGKPESLNKIRPALRTLLERNPDLRVNLFGYPEWQTYAREMTDDFYLFDTYIYSSFYIDNRSEEAMRFNTKFRYWFGKNPSGFPRFGMLGFDTGMFFIDAIARFGINFEDYIDQSAYKGLQTGFSFRRVNNWGGFINANLFLIRYNRDNHRIQWQEVKQ
jgi:LysM repeat protein